MNLFQMATKHKNIRIQPNIKILREEELNEKKNGELPSNYKLTDAKDLLYTLKYTDLSVNWEDVELRRSRGLIIDYNGNIIAHPFDKFFNLNETNNGLHSKLITEMSLWKEEPFTATLKRDGSMITVFLNPFTQEVDFATSGSVYSDVSNMAKFTYEQWDSESIKRVKELVNNYTLMFEYTSMNNLIVIPYDKDELTLIGARDKKTDELLTYDELLLLISETSIPLVEKLNLNSLEEIQEFLENNKDIEGVVVFFNKSRQLLKMKTLNYIKNHRNIPKLGVGERISSNYLKYLVTMILNDKLGDIYDFISYYRQFNNVEMLQKIDLLEEAITFITKQISLTKEIETKINDWIEFVDLDETKLTSIDLLDLNGFLVPKWFAFSLKKEISLFHKRQKEYFDIIQLLSQLNSELAKTMRVNTKTEAGEYGKYDTLISPKSFLFQQFDYKRTLQVTTINYMKNVDNIK